MNTSHLSRDPLALTILALLAEQPRHPYEIQRLIWGTQERLCPQHTAHAVSHD